MLGGIEVAQALVDVVKRTLPKCRTGDLGETSSGYTGFSTRDEQCEPLPPSYWRLDLTSTTEDLLTASRSHAIQEAQEMSAEQQARQCVKSLTLLKRKNNKNKSSQSRRRS